MAQIASGGLKLLSGLLAKKGVKVGLGALAGITGVSSALDFADYMGADLRGDKHRADELFGSQVRSGAAQSIRAGSDEVDEQLLNQLLRPLSNIEGAGMDPVTGALASQLDIQKIVDNNRDSLGAMAQVMGGPTLQEYALKLGF